MANDKRISELPEAIGIGANPIIEIVQGSPKLENYKINPNTFVSDTQVVKDLQTQIDDIVLLNGDMSKSVYDVDNDGIVDKATADKNGDDITTTYATKTELSGKSNTGHTHQYSEITNVPDLSSLHTHANKADLDNYNPANFASSGHTHDDRYYTESEVDTLLLSKSNTGHTHTGTYQPVGSYEVTTNKNQNNGYAGLDNGGKIPTSLLPTTLLKYVGTWNALTNTPTLTNPDLTKIGEVYNVSVSGTQFGIDFSLGDWLIYNASGVPEKSDNSDDVTSVNGQQGAVVLTAANVGAYTTGQTDTLLAGKSDTSHNHSLSGLTEKSYNSLTDKPDLSSLHTHSNKTTLDKFAWNTDDSTIEFPLDANSTLQLGQEELLRVYNNTGAQLTDGQVVVINGSSGTRPIVALADNSTELSSENTIGVVTQPIDNLAQGFITISGLVRGINTNSFNQGDILYLGVGGQLTNVKPAAPKHAVKIGHVIKKAGSADGIILVSIDSGYEITELHDVLISGATNNDVLTYETSTGIWKNKQVSSLGYYTSGQTDNLLNAKANLAGGNTITGTQTFDTNTLYIDSTNHRVGVNTLTPGSGTYGGADVKLDVFKNGGFPARFQRENNNGTFNQANIFLSSKCTANIIDGYGGNILFGVQDETQLTDSLIGSIGYGRDGADNSGRLIINTYNGSTTANERMTVKADGKVGIGTALPAEKLEVSGNIKSSGQLISSVATGTSPLSVTSTTKVTNLNADLLDGLDSTSFPLIQGMIDLKTYTGFINPNTIDVSYDYTGRTVTITDVSSINYYWRGVLKTLGNGLTFTTPAHTATQGNWYYCTTDGTNFAWSQTLWNFTDVMVVFVYRGADANSSYCIRETHGGNMEADVHENLHKNVGTYVKSGLQLTAGTYATNTATDAANSPGFDAGVLRDEDLSTTIPAWAEGTYTTMYVSGSGTSTFNFAATLPFLSAGSFLQYNNTTLGTLVTGQNNRYYNVYQLLIPAGSDTQSQKYRMVMIQPQAEYTSLALAQAESTSNINLGSLAPASEFVFYARITYVTATGDANTGKCRIATGGITYLTGSKINQTSVPASNVAASNVAVVASGNLTTDVQTSLVALDSFNKYTNRANKIHFFEDFTDNSYTSSWSNLTLWQQNGFAYTGFISNNTNLTNRTGCVIIGTDDTAGTNKWAFVGTQKCMYVGGGAMKMCTSILSSDTASAVNNVFNHEFALSDFGNNRIGFRTIGGNWVVTKQTGGGSTNDTLTGVALAQSTWYKLEIIISADGTQALCYINDTLVLTVSSGMPATTAAMYLYAGMYRDSNSGVYREFYIDYIGFDKTYTTAIR